MKIKHCMLLLSGALSGLLAVNQVAAAALEEITVTARKTDESLMEVPVSVSVVDTEVIDNANLQNIEQIAIITPNLKFNQGFGRQADRPVIRGLSSIFTRQELVGYFVDGVWVSGTLATFDLSNLERIEVIKGPQAATFGRRTFSGAINYVTKGPSEDLSGNIQVQGGSNEYGILQGTISDTIGDFGYRVTGRYYTYGGDFSNQLPDGPKVSGQEQKSVNGSFVWDTTERSSLTLNLSYAQNKDDQYAILLQTLDPNDPNFCQFNNDPNTPFPSSYYCGELQAKGQPNLGGGFPAGRYGLEEERFRSALIWDYDMDWASIRWINAYNARQFDSVQDATFAGTFGQTPPPFPPGSTTVANDFHTVSADEESDFNSEFWLRGGEQLRWGAGAYFFQEKIDSDSGDADVTTPEKSTVSQEKTTNVSLMGTVEYDFTDRWTAGLELRYAEDKITQSEQNIGDPNLPRFGLPAAEFSERFKSLTYRLTASYQASDATSIYGNLSTGVLPGGFNTDVRLVQERPDLIVIKEQDITQLEFGVKSDITDSVRLTWALYGILWEDQGRSEAFESALPGPPVNYEANQGDTQIIGTEAYVSWFVTDWLTWGVGGAYNDTELKDFCSPDTTDRNIAGIGGVATNGLPCADLSGNKAPLAPDYELTTNLTLNRDIGNSGLELISRLDLSYQDSRFVRPVNKASVGSETILNLTVGLQQDNWRFSLWGKNLTGEDSAVSALRYIEAPNFTQRAFAVTPRPGAEYGATFEWRFGDQ